MVGFSKLKKFLKLDPFIFKIDPKHITNVTSFAPKRYPFHVNFWMRLATLFFKKLPRGVNFHLISTKFAQNLCKTPIRPHTKFVLLYLNPGPRKLGFTVL